MVELFATGGCGSGSGADPRVLLEHGVEQARVTLAGEVDFALHEEFTRVRDLIAARPCPVIVDVGAVSFMDSSGLAFLAGLVRAVSPQRVQVLRPSSQVSMLLRLTRMDVVLDVGAE